MDEDYKLNFLQIFNSHFPDKSIKVKARVENIVINTKHDVFYAAVCKFVMFLYKTRNF